MLTISDVTYRVGGKRGRALLDHASAQIPEGFKLGLVGRNGIGKSTLLDLIRGRLMPDDGDIVLPRLTLQKPEVIVEKGGPHDELNWSFGESSGGTAAPPTSRCLRSRWMTPLLCA